MDRQLFSNILSLFGVSHPPQPDFASIIPGPFQGKFTITSGLTTAIDLINAAVPALSFDPKLNQVGIKAGATHPTGYLLCAGWGIDLTAEDNTEDMLEAIQAQWNVEHIPQTTQRIRALGFAHASRYPFQKSSTATDVNTVAGNVPIAAILPVTGGSWAVNCQSDALLLAPGPNIGAGVVLTTPIQGTIRLDGLFVTQDLAMQVGIDKLDPCDVTPGAIAAVLGHRRSLGLPTGMQTVRTGG